MMMTCQTIFTGHAADLCVKNSSFVFVNSGEKGGGGGGLFVPLMILLEYIHSN